jgi:CRP-like cAMP-binding protein
MSTQMFERNAFLAGLSSDDFSLLGPHLAPKELRGGDILHRYGELIADVVFPCSGVVILTATLRNEAGACMAVIGCDGFVGGISAAAFAPATCDGEVLIPGQGLRISASTFRYALDRSPTFRRRAAQFDTVVMLQAQQTALCNAAHPVEARLCRYLLEVQDRSGGDRLPLTQGTLARLLGVRRTTVTLVAGRLEAAGALNCRRGFMQFVDRAGIEQSCCECYQHLKSYAVGLEPDQSKPMSVVDKTPKALVGSRSI